MAAAEDPLLKNLESFVAFTRKRVGDDAPAASLAQVIAVKSLSADRKPVNAGDPVAWF